MMQQVDSAQREDEDDGWMRVRRCSSHADDADDEVEVQRVMRPASVLKSSYS